MAGEWPGLLKAMIQTVPDPAAHIKVRSVLLWGSPSFLFSVTVMGVDMVLKFIYLLLWCVSVCRTVPGCNVFLEVRRWPNLSATCCCIQWWSWIVAARVCDPKTENLHPLCLYGKTVAGSVLILPVWDRIGSDWRRTVGFQCSNVSSSQHVCPCHSHVHIRSGRLGRVI